MKLGAKALIFGGAASAILTGGWIAAPKYDAAATTVDTTATDSTTTDTTSSTSSSSSTSDSTTTDSTGATTTDTTTSATPSETATETATYTGTAVQTRYGVYQVQITVAGSTVTDVSLVQNGANDHESVQIKNMSEPTLIDEVLTNQTWDVSYVSRATYTSYGFITSIEDAFQQAGLG